jgi:hypothetical protein
MVGSRLLALALFVVPLACSSSSTNPSTGNGGVSGGGGTNSGGTGGGGTNSGGTVSGGAAGSAGQGGATGNGGTAGAAGAPSCLCSPNEVCYQGQCCKPKTCGNAGTECGQPLDGCGGVLSCPDCSACEDACENNKCVSKAGSVLLGGNCGTCILLCDGQPQLDANICVSGKCCVGNGHSCPSNTADCCSGNCVSGQCHS